MKFKGTIVITDPCYLIKDEDWDLTCCEGRHGYSNKGFSSFIVENTIYGDWFCTTYSTKCSDVVSQLDKLSDLCKIGHYAFNEYGENSIQVKVYQDRIYEFFRNLEEVGSFCADAGMVGVFLLDEVLRYNPEFQEYIDNRPWCVTVIPDFDGEVEYLVNTSGDAHIIGMGNTNFFTTQTGL